MAGRSYYFDNILGVFLKEKLAWDVYLDSQIDGQPWHSQSVSADLTPARKQQARDLFARGFELYRSGDFVGADILVVNGLKIDPANYLGWFTLGEIGRSRGISDKHWLEFARRHAHHATRDLS